MDKQNFKRLVEDILRNGGHSVNTAGTDPEVVEETIQELSERGFQVHKQGQSLLFETKNRQLLKG